MVVVSPPEEAWQFGSESASTFTVVSFRPHWNGESGIFWPGLYLAVVPQPVEITLWPGVAFLSGKQIGPVLASNLMSSVTRISAMSFGPVVCW